MSLLIDLCERGGKLFAHIFCHRSLMYPFTVEGDTDWIARYFFTGGTEWLVSHHRFVR